MFAKLIDGGAPKWCIRVLCYWYCNQSLCVKWESVFSEFFPVKGNMNNPGLKNAFQRVPIA